MRSILTVAFVVLAATLANAKTMEVHPHSPVASFKLPEAWQTSRIERGIQASTEDEEVYLWVETYKPDELDEVISEHNKYWKEQGVEITGRDMSQHVENGATVQVVSEKATHEGEPTVLLYMEYDLALASKSNILITYWASPEGNKTHADDVKSFIDSMKITEK